MRRIALLVALCAAIPLFPADEVQCLLSFAVDEKSPRGARSRTNGRAVKNSAREWIASWKQNARRSSASGRRKRRA
jgi:hypothetical protein